MLVDAFFQMHHLSPEHINLSMNRILHRTTGECQHLANILPFHPTIPFFPSARLLFPSPLFPSFRFIPVPISFALPCIIDTHLSSLYLALSFCTGIIEITHMCALLPTFSCIKSFPCKQTSLVAQWLDFTFQCRRWGLDSWSEG